MKQDSSPKVTVGIPTYNQSNLLKQTIHSVLVQTLVDFELIIVDDCSTDDTETVVRAFTDPRIKYIKTPKNLKPPASYNIPLNEAKGEYFMLLDHDDLLLPTYLENMTTILDKNNEIGFVQCSFLEFNNSLKIINVNKIGEEIKFLNGIEAVDWQLNYLGCKPAAIMLRLEMVRNSEEKWKEYFWDDWAFYLRIAYRYGFVYTPDIFCCTRTHNEQLSTLLLTEKKPPPEYTLDQLMDVFGVMQPFSYQATKLVSKYFRPLSISYFFWSIKNFFYGNFKLSKELFSTSRYLNPLIPFDLMIFKQILNKVIYSISHLSKKAEKKYPELVQEREFLKNLNSYE